MNSKSEEIESLKLIIRNLLAGYHELAVALSPYNEWWKTDEKVADAALSMHFYENDAREKIERQQ
jgi:hypothetical protein